MLNKYLLSKCVNKLTEKEKCGKNRFVWGQMQRVLFRHVKFDMPMSRERPGLEIHIREPLP